MPSRRTLLAGAATSAATGVLAGAIPGALTGTLAGAMTMAPAHAAAPLATRQAPGFYRYKVGSFEVTVVNDGVGRFPITEGFVTNAPAADVNAALAAAFMPPGTYVAPYNPILVNTGAKLVLIDTGTGEAAGKANTGLNGNLLPNMAAAGIDPASVDAVILSHFHGDHINGLLRADGSAAFPNAEVLAPAVEHRFWSDSNERGRAATQRMKDGFTNVSRVLGAAAIKDRLRLYDWDKEVVGGITATGTPGHTPGHTSLVVASGNQSVFVQGDVTHAPFLFARHPAWHIMLDVDGDMAEATRRRVYDMLAAERMAVQGFHYPFPALAHVERTATGYREDLSAWSAVL